MISLRINIVPNLKLERAFFRDNQLCKGICFISQCQTVSQYWNQAQCTIFLHIRHNWLAKVEVRLVRQRSAVGFTSAADRRRSKAFMRRSATLRYRADSNLTFDSICTKAHQKLFSSITGNRHHLLHSLLPPQREQHYSHHSTSSLPAHPASKTITF